MKNPLEYIGLGDGDGNISSTRLLMFLVGLSVLIPKFVTGIKTGQCQWTTDDMGMLAVAFGFKSLGSHLENQGSQSKQFPAGDQASRPTVIAERKDGDGGEATTKIT